MIEKDKLKLETAIVIWLIGLSFYSGIAFKQIQTNTEMIEEMKSSRARFWDRLNDMQSDIAEIAGYIRAQEKERKL